MERHGMTKWVLGAAMAMGAAVALADDDAPGRPHGPPPEAVAACSSVQEGAACGFTMGGHAITGTCRTGRDGQSAACMPPHRGPPPEAFQACQGLSEGVACSVTFHDQAMAGTCRTGPGGQGELACAPARPPGQ